MDWMVVALCGLGAGIGIMSGVLSIGGGFVALPALLALGIPAPAAIAAMSVFLCINAAAGTLTHYRRKTIHYRLVALLVAGAAVGIIVGQSILHSLIHLGHVDMTVGILYTLTLGAVAAVSLRDAKTAFTPPHQHHAAQPDIHQISVLLLGTASGMLVSLLGVGGGFLLVPTLTHITRIPHRMIAGTAFAVMMISAGLGMLTSLSTSESINWGIALPLSLGGIIGTYVGLYFARQIRMRTMRYLFGVIALGAAIAMAAQIILKL